MSYQKVTFQVRLKTRETLRQLGDRVGQAIECRFAPSFDRMFSGGEGMEATCLGLKITLSHDPAVPDGELRTYVLRGALRDDIEAQWDLNTPSVSISNYILGVIRFCDNEGWYIADRREKLDEAGF
jgi:hypothetical protein